MVDYNNFTYVRIPVDDTIPLQELRAAPIPCGDTLAELLKMRFAGKSLTNVDVLRAEYGDAIDQKLEALQKVADRGSVELMPLVRPSKTTLPLASTATYLYYDEMGCLKDRPPNKRAVELARHCGIDLEHPLLGDVFVGRVCCDPGPISVSIGVHELDSSAPWIKQAPAENAAWKGLLEEFSDATRTTASLAKTAAKEQGEEVCRDWSWTQTEADVEVTIRLPEGTTKQGLNVVIGRSTLRVGLKSDIAQPLVNLELYAQVATEDCTWTMGTDVAGPYVQVTLVKLEEETWRLIETKNKRTVKECKS